MRIVRSQIFYCKLEIEINTKIKMFFIYVTLLKDKETLKNFRISTRNNIVAIYRNLTSLNLSLIDIFYRFKAIIDFSFIFDIKNVIIKRAS